MEMRNGNQKGNSIASLMHQTSLAIHYIVKKKKKKERGVHAGATCWCNILASVGVFIPCSEQKPMMIHPHPLPSPPNQHG